MQRATLLAIQTPRSLPLCWAGKYAERIHAMSNLIAFRDRVSCTVEEACGATGLGRTTLYKLIKESRIAARKIGRRTVILVPTLLAEIESSCAELTRDGPEAAPMLADVSSSTGVVRRVRAKPAPS